MPVQGDIVLPELQLHPCNDDTGQDCNPRQHAEGDSPVAPSLEAIGNSPGDHDEDADQRHIAVTVRHRLQANLNEADDRNKGSEIPEPSNAKVRKAFCIPDHQERCGQQKERRPQDLPQRIRIRTGVKDGKVPGPEGLFKVCPIGNQGIGNAFGRRELLKGLHGPFLGKDCGRTR